MSQTRSGLVFLVESLDHHVHAVLGAFSQKAYSSISKWDSGSLESADNGWD